MAKHKEDRQLKRIEQHETTPYLDNVLDGTARERYEENYKKIFGHY